MAESIILTEHRVAGKLTFGLEYLDTIYLEFYILLTTINA